MSYTRKDVFEQMLRNGYSSEAYNYRDTCERHGHSMYERVNGFSVEDGASFSRAGDISKCALEDLQAEERRADERRIEERQREAREEQQARQRHYEQRLECEQEDNRNEE